MSEKEIKVARYSLCCTVLGPGRRGVVWVQGCSRHCPGCTAPETWAPNEGTALSVDFLADLFCSRPELEGLTFSGGEPMLQAESLMALIDACLKKRPEFTFMAYSGFTLEELTKEADLARLGLLARLDLLVDGPYVEKDHENLLWRGSRNQQIWFLTPRYQEWRTKIMDVGVHLEVEIAQDSLHCMGIPPKNFRKSFETIVQSLVQTEMDPSESPISEKNIDS